MLLKTVAYFNRLHPRGNTNHLRGKRLLPRNYQGFYGKFSNHYGVPHPISYLLILLLSDHSPILNIPFCYCLMLLIIMTVPNVPPKFWSDAFKSLKDFIFIAVGWGGTTKPTDYETSQSMCLARHHLNEKMIDYEVLSLQTNVLCMTFRGSRPPAIQMQSSRLQMHLIP